LALNGLGIALDTSGRHAEAQASYRRALAIAPEGVAARNNLGLSLGLSGNYDEAIAELRPIALGGGAVPRARQNLAVVLALKGDHDDAAKLARVDLREDDVQSNLKVLAMLHR
jgi:Flp pilus assembly protein TadD